MEVRPSSGITNNNILVDRLLGDQYRVVKTVYKNLDSLKPITEGKVDIEFLKENLNTFQTVTNQKADIKNVSDNLQSILNTPKQAQDYANLSKSYSDKSASTLQEAYNQSSQLIVDATKVADQLTEDAYSFKTTVDQVMDISDEIQIVASIKGDVVKVSQNADDLVKLSGYVDESFAKPYPIQDWGIIGADNESPDGSTSPLVIVANNIAKLVLISENIDYIRDLANNGKVEYLADLAANINKYIEQIRFYKQEIEGQLEIFDKKKEEYEVYTNQQIAKLDELIKIHDQTIKDSEAKLQETAKDLEQLKTDCEESVEQVSRYLIEIKDYYSLCHERIEVAVRNGLVELQNLKDDLKRQLLNAFDDSIGRIDLAVNSAASDASKFLENKANVLFDELSGKLKADSDLIKNQALSEIKSYIEGVRNSLDEYVLDKKREIRAEAKVGQKLVNAETIEGLASIKTEENNAITRIREAANKILKELASGASGVYRDKGSVATKSELPRDATKGDVYNVDDTGLNYVWTGTNWDSLGIEFNSDLGIIGSN